MDGACVFNHGSADDAAGMVREKGAAGAVVEGAVPAVGGTAGQALEDGDPVTADALGHGVTVVARVRGGLALASE